MKPFREVEASKLCATDLSEEMRHHGYVLVRGLLSPADLSPLLREITHLLADAGWLLSGRDPIQRIANASAACADGHPLYKGVYQKVFQLHSFHRLPHHAILQETMRLLAGPELFIHPKSAARLIFPHFERGTIRAHQDHTAVGGDEQSFTAWMPLHDCPVEQGSLRIKSGSHRFGLQPTAGKTGYISSGAVRGDDWVGGDINSGDLLLFHSLTIHEALPNVSDRLRISLDCRFQNYRRPVNPAALVFTGSSGRSWESVYRDWVSDDLKYYWRKLPLELNPSKLELAELAANSASIEMRSRYARILERIEQLAAVDAT
jgi:ectoine hydroxylase-related dioxygenase (phytanoyl-CoA dioxygenase family)